MTEPAKQFARHSSDKGNVKLSALGCPLCGAEMNLLADLKTVYGALYGPRASVNVRVQCQRTECAYYERTTVEATDDATLKALEAQFLAFSDVLPSLGRWKKSKVVNGQYRYRGPNRK